ncbi:hypothetical protein FIBSPDRAFT_933362 [Athelia psychrophila]|uniref:Queuosine 5'-phosphate N-glycosylase/hydrolase n=1 Tax=Athelia psychrophila TaxID=1759441 RepID=A0A166H8C2_9AGAM|nr:hypothetical protein FIBSPDRAFT_933362 [Fibularhizoctonia sp. CBS 109695]
MAIDDLGATREPTWRLRSEGRRGRENPVVKSAEFAFLATGIVGIDKGGVESAARYIYQKLLSDAYTPRTWRTHPLHICPPEPYSAADPLNEATLNWIFLISSLNFSFWSEMEGGRPYRYGVEWREGWNIDKTEIHTGYWSLVAALDRALEEGIPITDPTFYSSAEKCPDSMIEYIFRPAAQSTEVIPLLQERISIMREVGSILCRDFQGSFKRFVDEFHRRTNSCGTAIQLVQMVTDTFPSFQDETWLNGRKVYIWKRAQILVAETWAAFYPPTADMVHPIFPGPAGPVIGELTMFADYRVPQILHHLRILSYPPALIQTLEAGVPLVSGSREEISIRTASIVAVERVREEITRLRRDQKSMEGEEVSSVLIDFYLWDLAKDIETGSVKVEGIKTTTMVAPHRTRSIWY